MADPLSITVTVASSVATAGKLLNSINAYRTKFKACDLAALSFKAQCDCILVALGQIQTTLLSKQQLATRLMSDESISGQSLKSVLGACEITFLVMVDRLAMVDRCIHTEPYGSSTKDKFSRLWNESEINELGQNISRLSDGLNLLLTALNTKSQLDTLEILTSNRASIILEKVADDASSILFSGQNESLISRVTSNSMDEDLVSEEVDPKDFSFDQEVLMTPAYRKINISAQQYPIGSRAECAELENTSTDGIALSKILNEAEDRGTGAQNDGILPEIPAFAPLAIPQDSKTTSEEIIVTENKLLKAMSTSQSQMAASRVPEDGSERVVTLNGFWPAQSRQSISTPLKWQRHKLWVTPTEIVIVGQDIQDISGRIVEAVRRTLVSLCLSQNKIRSLPKSFGRCQSMQYLNLRQNDLKTFPREICHIQSLKTLHLSLNEIESIPFSFQNLSNLEFLNIACNKFSDLPSFLAQMSELTTIYAHGNPYSFDKLQAWQAQHGTYHPFPSAAQQATIELKQILRDKSFLAVPELEDQQEYHPSQLSQNDLENSPDQSENSNDHLVEFSHKFLKDFASTSYLKDGRVMDLYFEKFHS